MKSGEAMSKFQKDGIKDFDLEHIFDCGQCFRWEREEDGSYTGIAMGKVVNMAFDSDRGVLTIDNCDRKDFEEIWHRYLDLDRDYGQIKKTLSDEDDVMKKAISHGTGIRILRQDLWETIVSFLISQNNNIPRIKGCIENLSREFGDFVGEYRGKEYYSIPEAKVLAGLSPSDLGSVKLGYRARYIVETASCVFEKGMPNTMEQLTELCGVGPKVANCIALFGMGKYDSFPIDVWVRRVMNLLYGIDENDKKAMADFADKHFGELGGFAQQYLFYYIRENS